MDDTTLIYVQRLRRGKEEILDFSLSPDFLEVDEEGISFTDEVKVSGKAYLAGDELVVHFTIRTNAKLPCKICTQLVTVPVVVEDVYVAVPLSEISSGVHDLRQLLRETVLFETPHFVECSGGHCPERKDVEKFLKKESSNDSEKESFRPFADL